MIIISTIAIIVGGINWLSIGLLQYDFIAGFFGTQASIFSRLVYIAIGVCTCYVLFELVKNKGKLFLFAKKNKSKASRVENSSSNNQTQIHHNNDILE